MNTLTGRMNYYASLPRIYVREEDENGESFKTRFTISIEFPDEYIDEIWRKSISVKAFLYSERIKLSKKMLSKIIFGRERIKNILDTKVCGYQNGNTFTIEVDANKYSSKIGGIEEGILEGLFKAFPNVFKNYL